MLAVVRDGRPAGRGSCGGGDDDVPGHAGVDAHDEVVARQRLHDSARAAHGEGQRSRRGGANPGDDAQRAVERLPAREGDRHRGTDGQHERRRCRLVGVRNHRAGRSRARVDAEAAAGAGRPVRERAAAAVEEDAHPGRCGPERAGEERDPAVGRRRGGGERHRLGVDDDMCLRGLAVGRGRGHRRRPEPGCVRVLHARAVGGRSVAEVPVVGRRVAGGGQGHGQRRLSARRRGCDGHRRRRRERVRCDRERDEEREEDGRPAGHDRKDAFS